MYSSWSSLLCYTAGCLASHFGGRSAFKREFQLGIFLDLIVGF